MNEQSNVKIIEDMYAAFGRGDVAFIVGKLTDDIQWTSHIENVVPWSGDFSGKARVPRFFEAIFQSVDVTAFEPQEWIAQGDTVVSLGRFGCRVRTTGKSSDARWVFIWRFRDGKVCAYEQFHDPALAAAFH